MDWGSTPLSRVLFLLCHRRGLVTIAIAYTGFLLSPRTITIGASGGIFGILLAYGMIYGDREIFMFPLPFRIKAKYMVGILIFIEIAMVLQGPVRRWPTSPTWAARSSASFT